MNRPFQVVASLALLLVAFAALRYSENGRYSYIPETERSSQIVFDTRTGELWQISSDGFARYAMQEGTVTIHQVHVEDLTRLDICLDGKSASWLLHPVAMHHCQQPQ